MAETETKKRTGLGALADAGATVLMVTHEAAEAERMGAKIVGLLDSKG